MKIPRQILYLLLILPFALSACGRATTTPTVEIATQPPQPTQGATQAPQATETTAPQEDVLYVNLVWHQHQPLYYKNDAGVYTRPWVRVHATKDYYDMAQMVSQYPNVHATFNLTPVLIKQLDDFANNGAKDLYWVMAEKPASSLTDDDKRFILQRFFDANLDNIVSRFPRYRALYDKRGGATATAIEAALKSYTEQDFRDLQIWFNLAWFDPDFLSQDPLKSLVDKGQNFAEEDKQVVFDQALKIIQKVIPLHKELQDSGQIEVITSPYSHPILPLLYDTKLALVGNPSAEMPNRFSYPNDAIAQLQNSVEVYKAHYGQEPRGLWPGEGAVAQEIVPLVAKAGYTWMATGEPVLAQSLGIGSFTKDANETIQEADELYRPYYVTGPKGEKVAVFFRDWRLSDLLGFEYSQKTGEAAAQDLMKRLENIRARLKEQGATGPHVVSIILDGENAWEYYKNDGKDFFHAMYQAFSDSKTIKTITPSDYLKQFPEQRNLDKLFPGAWFSPNYDTWIGEPEETQAWNYLGKVRADLAKYDMPPFSKKADPAAIAKAEDFMYLAEGSDWFWWYGSDQDSGQDSYFDTGFRALLAEVYKSLGVLVPSFVNVPIIPNPPVQPVTNLQGLSKPVIDGTIGKDEWAKAATYAVVNQEPVTGFSYAIDQKNLYVKLDLTTALPANNRVGVYLNIPKADAYYPFTTAVGEEKPVLLGIAASHLIEWDGKTVQLYKASDTGWAAVAKAGSARASAKVVEMSIPLAALGETQAGDDIRMVAYVSATGQVVPTGGPAQLIIPDLGLSTEILKVEDPSGDDHGPGSYTYPTDTVFTKQVFDLKEFSVASDGKNLIFKFNLFGAVPNPWGSGNNLSIQTLDVYIDKDPGKGTGARMLLPGRNAALAQGNGWEYALWAEGWTPEVLAPDSTTLEPKQVSGVDFKIIVDPATQTVTLRVPLSTFGDGDPTKWGYAAVVLSQDGYPSTGVWRVRDVNEQAAQWKLGGAPADTNHTRIIDLAWPAGAAPTQEDMLGKYASSAKNLTELTADDFPQIQMNVLK